MPKTDSRPLAILGLFMLSAALVSCEGTKSDIVSAGTDSLHHSDKPPAASHKIAGESSTLSSNEELSDADLQDTPDKSAPPEVPFRADAPSLCGIGFGASEGDVIGLYGVPDDSYVLPGDDNSIQIWEYRGFSVGMSNDNTVVYVEISSAEVRSGILGLSKGMKGGQAAELLGVRQPAGSNVISLQVAGGSLKLDLDPDSQAVLSLKLISNEI
ncbi:hypothetical protein [Cohnella kolymensis]|uniref:hypothetical protein n=1 Tax=Cohnella kolymensis TaxID=1590652 RepID=UPI0006991C87|nr:hypothetical protein [Cohnella kolymensis]